jgi:hypothetical protein
MAAGHGLAFFPKKKIGKAPKSPNFHHQIGGILTNFFLSFWGLATLVT